MATAISIIVVVGFSAWVAWLPRGVPTERRIILAAGVALGLGLLLGIVRLDIVEVP